MTRSTDDALTEAAPPDASPVAVTSTGSAHQPDAERAEPGPGPGDEAAPVALVARTVALPTAVDPVDLAGADGAIFTHPAGSLVGIGVARRISLPPGSPADAALAVAAALTSIPVLLDEIGGPGTGPVAIGALPFSRPALGPGPELVIPQITVGRAEDGRTWITTITPARDGTDTHDAMVAAIRAPDASDAPGLADPSGRPVLPGLAALPDDAAVRNEEAAGAGKLINAMDGTFRVAPGVPPEVWCARVSAAVLQLRGGALRKVVLAREVAVQAGGPIDRRAVLGRLRDTYPGCMLFAVEGFVGASPELLVARHGDRVRSHPLAGTAPRSADTATDERLAAELRASAKNREEHRITIDMVHDTLLPYCSYLDEEAEPSIVPMANVQHLGTMVEGRLSSPAPSVLELALALHPTPAVGGWPVAPALALIEELEGIDRGRYAGPVGWVDAAGNGEWAVGIRSAELTPDRHGARVFAGVGIVTDSDPQSELAETRAKFQAMLSALIRP